MELTNKERTLLYFLLVDEIDNRAFAYESSYFHKLKDLKDKLEVV